MTPNANFECEIQLNFPCDETIDHHEYFIDFFPRDGILYSLSNAQPDEATGENVPKNVAFFEVLHEFVYRLAAQDRTGKHGVYVAASMPFVCSLCLTVCRGSIGPCTCF